MHAALSAEKSAENQGGVINVDIIRCCLVIFDAALFIWLRIAVSL